MNFSKKNHEHHKNNSSFVSKKLKTKFPYAPDNIDAARSGPNGFIFYKDFNYYTSRKVGSLPGKLLK